MSSPPPNSAAHEVELLEAAMLKRSESRNQKPLIEGLREEGEPCVLHLADGETTISGYSFGARVEAFGEVVFNTGMVGYPEALTDASYRGQILVLTFPLVGNYGVPDDTVMDDGPCGLPKYFESHDIHIRGLIVSSYTPDYSHWNAAMSLGAWLVKKNIPAMFGVDTRALTKILRERGTMLGKIAFAQEANGKVTIPRMFPRPATFVDPASSNLVAEVSIKQPRVFKPTGVANPLRVIAYDCGIKYNIIRMFVHAGVELTVVPYNFLLTEEVYDSFDGIFISNGPGNPEMASETVTQIRSAFKFGEERRARFPDARTDQVVRVKPIFGICLGNQLLAIASGAKTYKLRYGNRGMNQPCVDLRTTKCYITAQNHGYAVDESTLSPNWMPMFMNANDFSNEGIVHSQLPYFSVQFHPEANGGPMDTPFLFDQFLQSVKGQRNQLTTVPKVMFQAPIVRKCLLVGSGGLSIGQAGEFDYSGSQAIKALKEENIQVVLINPNIATVQTMDGFADRVYFLPVTPERVLDIIEKERPDSIIVSMGGQTALNVGVELWKRGELQKRGVRVLGTPIEVIIATEDREIFSQKLAEIGESCARSKSATTVEEACAVANELGYPVLVRVAFALGGLGSGFVKNEAEMIVMAEKAFAVSDQLLIDEDLRGWKEIEVEVVRDCKDNCLTVCNMENFDPLGVHTGDSIVIAPSQTLSNSEYFMLRRVSLKVIRHLGVIGECNIQFALHPDSERYCIIEVNARLSRSSALASKATGYPLAYVAAKLSLGKDLVSVRNNVTRHTTACFEPSLDYVVIKIPRWDLKKFSRVDATLGSAMKSVGEVMAIGRSFEEVIQKAVRCVDLSIDGFGSHTLKSLTDTNVVDNMLKNPTHMRLFAVARALELGYSVDQIHSLTRIDKWFLSKLERIQLMKDFVVSKMPRGLNDMSREDMVALKSTGFSDSQIAKLLPPTMEATEKDVRAYRQSLNVRPFVKQIDTLAAEFPAFTNYLYTTYNATAHDITIADGREGVVVLGGGPYCIGSSVEFDWCAVSCIRALRSNDIPAAVINCNPETVSTDYDESDRLYFDELSLERVMDIYEFERSVGLIVSVGGQIPNTLALPLYRRGCKILGTHPNDIDIAEDRNKFSAMLDKLGIDQPPWKSLTDPESAQAFAAQVGFPVLVRPSYVLSGAAMRVASRPEELAGYLTAAASVNSEHPVVISKFFESAKEIEYDAVAQDGKILNYAISEHVENAGTHSGDATLVLPAQRLYVETIRQVKRIAAALAQELKINGPFNMQFLGLHNHVKVIECNLRASRSFPFVSKTFNVNFADLATRVMVGIPAVPKDIRLIDLDVVGVKVPMFSFARLKGADPTLGVEMMSTGEVACYGQDVHHALLLAMIAGGTKMPTKKVVLFSVGPMQDKLSLAASADQLLKDGYKVYATPGTAEVFQKICVNGKIQSVEMGEDTLNLVRSKMFDFVVNIPDSFAGSRSPSDFSAGYVLRRTTIDFGMSLLTNAKVAEMFITSVCVVKTIPCASMEDFYQLSLPNVVGAKPILTQGHVHDTFALPSKSNVVNIPRVHLMDMTLNSEPQ